MEGSDFVQFFVQFAGGMGWLPVRIVGAATLGLLAYGLYQKTKEPSDAWDEFLKTAGLIVAIISAVYLLAELIQFLRLYV